MAIPTNSFNAMLHAAIAGGVETTLKDLKESLIFDSNSYLDQIQELAAFLVQNHCYLRPDLTVGSDGDVRLLRYGGGGSFEDRLRALCADNEQVDVEFKSTAFIALRALREERVPTANEVEGVIDSLMKAICGFLNKDGGEVYVGVEASGALCGISFDLDAMLEKDRNFDGWSNRLTDQILSRFHEGEAVMRHVEMAREVIDGVEVVRISVAARARLSFFKKPGGAYRCAVRQNVRTVEVPIEEIPDLLTRRAG